METEKKHKILILTDLKKNTENTLKSALCFAEIINADIELFYTKKGSDVIKNDNQLSAKRAINKEYFTIDKKIKKLVNTISNDFNTTVNYSFTIGNVKNEIGEYLDKNKPDIVFIGKREAKVLNVLGDNLTDFLLSKHKGFILIASKDNTLKPNKNLSLGFLNNKIENFIADNLLKKLTTKSQEPLKLFRIVKKSDTFEESNKDLSKTIEYLFEENESVYKSISTFLIKNNVNLLCLSKHEKESSNSVLLKEVLNNTNVSILLTT